MATSYKIILTVKNFGTLEQRDKIESVIKIKEKTFQFAFTEISSLELNELFDESKIEVSFLNKETKKIMGEFSLLVQNLNLKEEHEYDNDFFIEENGNKIKFHYFIVIFNRKFSKIRSNPITPKNLESSKIYGIKREKDPSLNNIALEKNNLKQSNSFSQKSIDSKNPLDVQRKINFYSPTTTNPNTIKKKPLNSAGTKKSSNKSKDSRENSLSKTSKTEKLIKDDLFNQAIYNSIANANKLIENLTKEKKGIEECIYLNKINNGGDNEDPNAEARLNNVKEVIELSPSKLRARFEEKEKMIDKMNEKISGNSPLVQKPSVKSIETMKSEVEKFTEDYKKQTDYLKLVVLALDSKLKVLNNIEKENEFLKLEVKKSEENRESLQQTIRQGVEQLKAEQINTNNVFNTVMEEKAIIDDKLKELVKNFDNLKLIPTNNFENELREAKVSVLNLEDLKRQNIQLKTKIENKDKQMNELNEQFEIKIKEISEIIKDVENQRDNYFNEKLQLHCEINELKQKLENEFTKIKQCNLEIESLKTKNQILKVEESIFKLNQEEKKKLEIELLESKKSIEDQNSQIEKIKSEAIFKIREIEDQNKKLFEKNRLLEQKNLELEVKLNEKGNTIATLQKNHFDAKNQVARLEKQLILKEDFSLKNEQSKEKEDKLVQENQDFKNQIKMLTDQLLAQDEKNLELNTTLAQMKGNIVEKEEYNTNLKKMILDMRDKEGVYIPSRESQKIDKNMSDVISNINDPNKIKLLFIREGEGVYQFGTRKIYVKIEQDKIYIRVGGGFLTVEEFLEIYSPIELEKMLKNNPIKILTRNIAVNNTLAGRCVKEFEKPKNSPLNSKVLSQMYGKDKEKQEKE